MMTIIAASDADGNLHTSTAKSIRAYSAINNTIIGLLLLWIVSTRRLVDREK